MSVRFFFAGLLSAVPVVSAADSVSRLTNVLEEPRAWSAVIIPMSFREGRVGFGRALASRLDTASWLFAALGARTDLRWDGSRFVILDERQSQIATISTWSGDDAVVELAGNATIDVRVLSPRGLLDQASRPPRGSANGSWDGGR